MLSVHADDHRGSDGGKTDDEGHAPERDLDVEVPLVLFRVAENGRAGDGVDMDDLAGAGLVLAVVTFE